MTAEARDPENAPRIVLVTVPDVDSGRSLARIAVMEGLAACGNVIPGLTSIYRWDGELQEDREALVVFKTMEKSVEALRRRVVELHDYEVPEFLAIPVIGGHEAYLRWVAEAVGGSGVSE